MILKFGAHKGKDISTITDTAYLQSLLANNVRTIQRLQDPNKQDEILGFGQWQDSTIKELPDAYREWLLESSKEAEKALREEVERRDPLRQHRAEIDKLNRLLADACSQKRALEALLETAETKLRAAEKKARLSEKRAQEAEKRAQAAEAEKVTRKPPVSISHDSMYSIVASGFRQLAHKNHPDHGGDTDAMRKLIDGRDALMDAISAMGERKTA